MKPWSVRDFHLDDLDQLVAVWQESKTQSAHSVYSLAEIIDACSHGVAVVAVVKGKVVGAAVGKVQDDRAWVVLLSQATQWREQGLGSALLAGLEGRLLFRGSEGFPPYWPPRKPEFAPSAIANIWWKRIYTTSNEDCRFNPRNWVHSATWAAGCCLGGFGRLSPECIVKNT